MLLDCRARFPPPRQATILGKHDGSFFDRRPSGQLHRRKAVSHDRALLLMSPRRCSTSTRRSTRRASSTATATGYCRGRAAEAARWVQEFEQHEAEQQRLANDLSAARDRLSVSWRPQRGPHQRATRARLWCGRSTGTHLRQPPAVSKPVRRWFHLLYPSYRGDIGPAVSVGPQGDSTDRSQRALESMTGS